MLQCLQTVGGTAGVQQVWDCPWLRASEVADGRCVSYCPHCCDKLPDKRNLRKEEFTLTHNVRVQSVRAGTHGGRSEQLCQREPQSGEMNTGVHLSLFHSAQDTSLGNGATHSQSGSSHQEVSSQTSPGVCFHGDSFLNPVKLSSKMSHHTRFAGCWASSLVSCYRSQTGFGAGVWLVCGKMCVGVKSGVWTCV